MKIWNNVFLREPMNGDGNEAGGLADVWNDESTGEENVNLEQDGGEGQQQGAPNPDVQQLNTSQQQAPSVFDANQFGDAMAQALLKAGVVAPQQQQAKPEMSDEEFQKITHYYKVPAEQVTALFGNPPDTLTAEEQNAWIVAKQQALQTVLDNAVKHPIAVSRLAAQTDMQAFQRTVTPIIEERRKQEHNALLSDMAKGNTVLAGMQNGAAANILNIAINSLRAENFRPRDEAQARQAIYARVEQLGRVSNPNFTLNLGKSQGQNNGAGRAAGMTSTVNSGGGGGQHNGGGKPKNALVAAYD